MINKGNMMKRILLLVLAAMITSGYVRAEKMRVAVLDLEPKNAPKGLTLAISDLLRVELIRLGVYEVLDRQNMNLILKEQAFQQTGCTSAECAVEVGQILNCEKMFVGSLARVGKRYFLSVQQINVETARVDYANSMEANNEESLPETAKVLAAEIVRGGTGSRLVKVGDVTEGRRFFFEFGGILAPKMAFESWTNEQVSIKYDIQYISPLIGLRFYPRSVYWLGLGCFAVSPGTNFSEPRDAHELIPAEVRELKIKWLQETKMRMLGCELFLDMTGPTKWARRRLQIMLAAGLVTFSWEEEIHFQDAGSSQQEEYSCSLPFGMVGVEMKSGIVRLMAGGVSYRQEVLWEEHEMPYQDPVKVALAGRETGLTMPDGGAAFIRLSLIF